MLLRHKAFRQLFAGRILSVFADSILFFSLLKWIEIKSGGTESFTFFYVAHYLPIVLLALPAGAWISGKTLQHVMACWLVILPLFFVQGIALGCFNITFVTYVQDIVEKENYTPVFSMYHMISSSAALPGISMTGVLLSICGVPTTILVISGILLALGIAGILAIPSLGKGNSAEQTNIETVAV
ncbi:hypothetical protein M3661_12520 [Paenibacillus sp. MER 180]|uniref:hypothetical protein n=1 Tax=Paenibacillus sp. MER 180 TaxID=2939570 RepID=UPI00203B33F2|nr:hypothetical protein [Paenibacillus sp. MER 180]MCM3290954.1 hypothetical protein [Paenibacillus sp. MER 180]